MNFHSSIFRYLFCPVRFCIILFFLNYYSSLFPSSTPPPPTSLRFIHFSSLYSLYLFSFLSSLPFSFHRSISSPLIFSLLMFSYLFRFLSFPFLFSPFLFSPFLSSSFPFFPFLFFPFLLSSPLLSVAGLVGEGLSRLFTCTGYEKPEVAEVSKTLANTMGLLLQKTNIIRDYLEDYVDGRAFWPQDVCKHLRLSETVFLGRKS